MAGCTQVQAGEPTSAPTVTQATVPEASPDSEPSTRAGVAAFGETYTYDDGLSVTVSDVARFDPDPGLLEALSYPADTVGVQYAVRVDNNTAEIYDSTMLSSTVLTGDAGVPAGALCDMGIDCFGAQTLPPGRTTTVTFGVGVPPADTGRLSVQVSPDFDHEASLWEGAAS